MSEPMKIPAGFRFASVDAGLAKGERPDLWLAVADEACPAAAVFTTNEVVASPVALSREHLRLSGGRTRAILVNAGCANACTGSAGDEDASKIAAEVAALVGCEENEVLLFSTGVIGQRLNVDAIQAALPGLHEGLDRSSAAVEEASRAILTTDLVTKVSQRSIALEGDASATMLGIAKGSGMICPNMATMLGFTFTDLELGASQALLLRAAVQSSYNRISVDGDTSTNDAVLLWSSAQRKEKAREESADGLAQLQSISLELAHMIVRDGEGATRRIEVRVDGALSEDQAERCARTIASSLLVRTAVHGGDPNWGRIVACVGRSGVQIDTRKLRVGIGDACLFEEDSARPEAEEAAAAALREDPAVIWAELGAGDASAEFWTCDLSADYVRINADYRS